jgi:hypothetical protein
MTERCEADHIVNLDIACANDMSRRNRRTGPLDSIRGRGKIKLTDNMEIRHGSIVGMPLLHCLQRAYSWPTEFASAVTHSRRLLVASLLLVATSCAWSQGGKKYRGS